MNLSHCNCTQQNAFVFTAHMFSHNKYHSLLCWVLGVEYKSNASNFHYYSDISQLLIYLNLFCVPYLHTKSWCKLAVSRNNLVPLARLCRFSCHSITCVVLILIDRLCALYSCLCLICAVPVTLTRLCRSVVYYSLASSSCWLLTCVVLSPLTHVWAPCCVILVLIVCLCRTTYN